MSEFFIWRVTDKKLETYKFQVCPSQIYKFDARKGLKWGVCLGKLLFCVFA